jgi:hypothetical protein
MFPLKLDLVNDVGFHTGEFVHNGHYHKIDNETGILNNKFRVHTLSSAEM